MSRLSLRLPESLHQQLAIQARREGVSLNQYLVFLLARYSGPSDPELTPELAERYQRLRAARLSS